MAHPDYTNVQLLECTNMNTDPRIRQLAHRLMGHDRATNRSSAKIALSTLGAFSKLSSSLTPVLGEVGSTELFRRTLRIVENPFPILKELRTADRSGLLAALGVFLQNQKPDVALESSIALLATYIELLGQSTQQGPQIVRDHQRGPHHRGEPQGI